MRLISYKFNDDFSSLLKKNKTNVEPGRQVNSRDFSAKTTPPLSTNTVGSIEPAHPSLPEKRVSADFVPRLLPLTVPFPRAGFGITLHCH